METEHHHKKSKKWFKQTGWVIALLIFFWPIGLFLMWKYTNWSKRVKIIVSIVEAIGLLLFWIAVANSPPSIQVDNVSNGHATTDDSSYKVTGTATLADIVTVNSKKASYDGSTFSATINLDQGDNDVKIVASKGDKQTEEHFTIHRTTDLEIKTKKDAQAAASAKKANDEAAAKAKTDADAKAKADADAAAKAKSDADAKAKADAAKAAAIAAAVTVSQKNALAKAKSYLSYTAFSHDGLVDQLIYEQFSTADATYGADNCGADWNVQAAKKAKSYMSYSSFSRGSLIAQLEYDKFTSDQAAYGANSVGL